MDDNLVVVAAQRDSIAVNNRAGAPRGEKTGRNNYVCVLSRLTALLTTSCKL